MEISPNLTPRSHFHTQQLLLFFVVTTTLFLPVISSQLSFSYPRFEEHDDTLVFEGDTYVNTTNSVLEISKPGQDSIGRAVYYKQLHLWDKDKVASFSTNFSFSIDAPNKTHHGDGLTFFLAIPNFPLSTPRDGAGLGLVSHRQMEDINYPDKYPFIAIEFDTGANDWDPIYNHVGIDVKSMNSRYVTEWFIFQDQRVYNASITYNSGTNNLSVVFTGYKNDTMIQQHLNAKVDLKRYLPEYVEFGFSAATGYYFEYHTLISWSFSSDMEINKSKKALVLGVSIGAGALIVISGLVACVWCYRVKRRKVEVKAASDEASKFQIN